MFRKGAIDASLEHHTYDYGMFRGDRLASSYNDDGFGNPWSALSTALIGAVGTIYTVKAKKKVAAAGLKHEQTMAAMAEKTKRMELALQKKQMELLGKAKSKAKAISKSVVGGLKDPTTLLMLAGAGVGVGLLIFIIVKKKKKR